MPPLSRPLFAATAGFVDKIHQFTSSLAFRGQVLEGEGPLGQH